MLLMRNVLRSDRHAPVGSPTHFSHPKAGLRNVLCLVQYHASTLTPVCPDFHVGSSSWIKSLICCCSLGSCWWLEVSVRVKTRVYGSGAPWGAQGGVLRRTALTTGLFPTGVLSFFFFSGRIKGLGKDFENPNLNYYWLPIMVSDTSLCPTHIPRGASGSQSVLSLADLHHGSLRHCQWLLQRLWNVCRYALPLLP